MIFCNNTVYGKVWKITKNEKYLDLQMTTSEKTQGTEGEYINSGWFPRVIGHAFNTIKDTIKEGDTIVITKCKFTNERYTAEDGSKKSAGIRLIVLDAHIDSKEMSSEYYEEVAKPESTQEAATTADTEDDPW